MLSHPWAMKPRKGRGKQFSEDKQALVSGGAGLTHPTVAVSQRLADVNFDNNYFYFNNIHRRCACSVPRCQFVVNFAQKSVPKIGKRGTVLGAICNLNELNILWATGRSFGDFSTKTPLSILTTPHGPQWRSSKICGWLEQGKHAA